MSKLPVDFEEIWSNIADLAWWWRIIEKIIKRIEEQLVWIFTGWLIDIYYHWVIGLNYSKIIWAKFKSGNWWARIGTLSIIRCKMILTEEFDHGSDWTLAAGLTHASRAEWWCLHYHLAADGWVMLRNLPISGGQHLERDANTAYVLREKAGDHLWPCANRWA